MFHLSHVVIIFMWVSNYSYKISSFMRYRLCIVTKWLLIIIITTIFTMKMHHHWSRLSVCSFSSASVSSLTLLTSSTSSLSFAASSSSKDSVDSPLPSKILHNLFQTRLLPSKVFAGLLVLGLRMLSSLEEGSCDLDYFEWKPYRSKNQLSELPQKERSETFQPLL